MGDEIECCLGPVHTNFDGSDLAIFVSLQGIASDV